MSDQTTKRTSDRQPDRRGVNLMTNVGMPLVIALIVGVGSSYFATTTTLTIVETKIGFIERDVDKMAGLVDNITTQNLLITKNTSALDGILYRVSMVENSIQSVKTDTKLRYLSAHAQRDLTYMERRLDSLQTEIRNLENELKGKK